MSAELPRIGLSYFEDTVPVPVGWTETKCGYVLLSDAYAEQAARAEASGWPVARIPGTHLSMVTDPQAVADAIESVAGLPASRNGT